jgi:flagellar hook-associated protein 1 FlgK
MSIFGSIQMAGNTLQAMQIGLHVVGNNIANANTPGYVRERVLYTPAPVMKLGDLTLGLGVEIAGVVQNIDRFVEERLRGVGGDRASAAVQEKVYSDLELILGELSDTDVSSSLTKFFNSINEVVKHPEDMAARNQVVQTATTLMTNINTRSSRANTVYEELAQGVDNLSAEFNTLTEQVRKLNVQIVSLEGGNPTANEAGGLRSQRSVALKRLSEIADVKIAENQVGAVSLTLEGELIVFEGTRREVKTEFSSEGGLTKADLVFADNGSMVQVNGGELHGIYEARDRIVGGFIERLDNFAAALAFEFNKVYSQGQGAKGFKTITSVDAVDSPSAALDAAGLAFTPVNGEFNVVLQNTKTGLENTTTINVKLIGLLDDSTLASIAAEIDAISGVTASVTSDNRLNIQSESEETVIAFDKDTSGLLAALGINTFFTGSKASDIAINGVVAADGSMFAASDAGRVGVGIGNAQKLVALHDEGLTSLNGSSITGVYDQLINETSQGATVAASIADGFEVFEQTLEAQFQSVSGVNLDEEAIDMIMLQRTYQASARYISTLSELMDVLVAL